MQNETEKTAPKKSTIIDKLTVAVGVAVVASPAMAAFDVSNAETALSGLIGAFGALGVIKVAPAITMWAWGKISSMAGRG